MCETFLDIYSPHGCVHRQILISFIFLTDGGYLSPNEIIIVRKEGNEGAKAKKQELKFM